MSGLVAGASVSTSDKRNLNVVVTVLTRVWLAEQFPEQHKYAALNPFILQQSQS